MSITFYISENAKKLENHMRDILQKNLYCIQLTAPEYILLMFDLNQVEYTTDPVVAYCIDAYLHPKWQRLIVPKLIKLYPNSEMHIGTNSPFVLNSVEGATIINLDTKKTKKREIKGESFTQVLLDEFEITFNQHFDKDTQNILDKFSS